MARRTGNNYSGARWAFSQRSKSRLMFCERCARVHWHDDECQPEGGPR